MLPDWLKFKRYPHIGIPLTQEKDASWVLKYVTDPQRIATHKFTPLLHRKIFQRKFRPSENAVKNEWGKRERSVQKRKERPIFFASHLDSIVYSYYSFSLADRYEQFISTKNYNKSVVAYRRIPNTNGSKANKCNIEFAYEAFEYIQKCKESKVSVIVADITSFFDNLDHKILHSQWKRVLGVQSLPDDHFSVFKSLTTKRYVNETDLYKKFRDRLIVERGIKNDSTKTQYREKGVKHIWNLKDERVVAYCSKQDFFGEATHLIRVEKSCSHQHKRCRGNCEVKGIPQGTPLSATLANIYMIDFDHHISESVEQREAFYQRYSDDLIIVCKSEDENYFIAELKKSVTELAKLEIQSEKTNVYRYYLENGSLVGGIVDSDGRVSRNKQLEYLGFSYDGTKVRVKTVGFSKFYRGMKRAFRRGVHFASKLQNKNHDLFEERLYKRFSYRGAKRRLIYKPDPRAEGGYKRTNEQYWGNYISYLEKANKVMKPINKDNSIRKQYSRFWPNFTKEMDKAYAQIAEKLGSITLTVSAFKY